MYMPEKKMVSQVEGRLRKHLPFLADWKTLYGNKKKDEGACDLIITARHRNEDYHFCVEIKRAGYPQYIREAALMLKEFMRRNTAYYPVVIAPKIGERSKKICDEHGVGYMDFVGNVRIVTGGIFVDIAAKDAARHDITEDEMPALSLFSPKSARITKCILREPKRKWIQKDISEKTGLSKGMVSRVVKRMLETGYLTRVGDALKLSDFDDLLNAWLDASLRRREKRMSFYIWAQNARQLMKTVAGTLSGRNIKYAFTQEAGASLVAPFSTFDVVILYIDSFDKFPADRLSATKAKKGFNLVLIEAPDDAIFSDSRDIRGMRVADNLQLYADLMKNPLRGDKQASHILNILHKGLK